MAIVSTVPAVKAGLITKLRARAGLADVSVEYNAPTRDVPRELVVVGSTRFEHDLAALQAGRKRRDETYTIELETIVTNIGGTPQEAELRAAAIVAEIENLLADNPRFDDSISGLLWARVASGELTAGWIDDGAQAIFRLDVACRARLD